MKVFWYSLFLLTALTAGVVGWRGVPFSHEPVQIFSDMVQQDRLNPQAQDPFFLDMSGPRPLPPGSVPQKLKEESSSSSLTGMSLTYSSPGAGYGETGVWDGYYGQNLPDGITPKSKTEALGLLERGRIVFENHCVVCHGLSGDGKGVVASYPGFPVLVDWMDTMYSRKSFPDGRLFFVITHGQGNMTGYGACLPVRDRWSIVSYIRALQTARFNAAKQPEKGGGHAR